MLHIENVDIRTFDRLLEALHALVVNNGGDAAQHHNVALIIKSLADVLAGNTA